MCVLLTTLFNGLPDYIILCYYYRLWFKRFICYITSLIVPELTVSLESICSAKR